MNSKERFNHKEAAKFLGIAEQTLYNWRSKRRGPSYVLLGRKIIYLLKDLEDFLDSHRIIIGGRND
ncbi:MAG: helix-turn-helix domain-containing protein [Bacteroidetes bacterium]|nr:helix-turn-helix domain-containing protein [Bacteroidota bacterium]